MEYQVAIIGAGVVGAMAARELSRYRLKICLLEAENDVAMGASKANSGIIHAGYDPEPGTLKARFNREGNPLLYEAARQLRVPHRNNGAFVCAFSPEEEGQLEALYRRGQENQIPGLSLLTGEEARALEPGLSPMVTRVLLAATSGIICPYELTIAAVGNAMDNGVALYRNFRVSDIQKKDNGFVLRSSRGESVQAQWIVNCAGVHAGEIGRLAGDPLPQILPRAGEYVLLDKNQGTLVSRTIFQVPTKAGKGILVTPTVDGNLLVGPTAQSVPDGDCTGTTRQGLETVKTLGRKSVPGVDYRQVIAAFAGIRASTPGKDFLLGQAVPGLFHAAAIDSPGLSCCVALGRYIAENLPLPKEENPNFNPIRENPHFFRELSLDEKNDYIRLHPEYGKIVCRCEGVSLGEIRAACKVNPRPLDMDGIKRRTRAMMGRCQGGFCTPNILTTLAKELGIAPEEVTKAGGESRLLEKGGSYGKA